MVEIMNQELNITATSPLYARDPIEGANSLRQLDLCGKLNIRGNADDPNLINGLKSVLDLTLPTVHSFSSGNSTKLYWLGPDEWLLHCDVDKTGEIEQRLRGEIANSHFAITEVSDYYTVIRLQGPDAAALLRRACPLDLHPDKFKSGDFAQTRFGQASILLHRQDDGECWDIQVRWTYAEYVWDYLVSSMKCL